LAVDYGIEQDRQGFAITITRQVRISKAAEAKIRLGYVFPSAAYATCNRTTHP
jgi:hypothetical protein